ncbi:MAG: hypothetical protein NTW03_04705, partial [Verrucomicrobia bacterium]|nr:hypothetical protein [Verrucomicrobiota bacterium]
MLLDVVGYTPQSRATGAQGTREFDLHFAEVIKQRAEPHGFHFIKTIGDAALLWGTAPAGLVQLILELFGNPIAPKGGITPSLRMLAHKDYFVFSCDPTDGRVSDVHGLEGITLFRLEKKAHLNRVVVTSHLFHGLRPLCERHLIGHQLIPLREDLKGMGEDSPRQVFLLTPPLAPQVGDLELPGPYRAARSALRDRVQFIPVFGNLYPQIPMAENFLDLTLDRQRTSAPGGYFVWRTPELARRMELAEARHGKISMRGEEGLAREAEKETFEARKLDHLTADELFAQWTAAVIAGLPGAGKTTILRHFAWRALEDNLHAVIVFVEARHLQPAHASPPAGMTALSPEHVFHVLASLFLKPGTLPEHLTPEDQDHIAETARALRRAWDDQKAIVLLDALDEAPTPALREWLAKAADVLMPKFDLGSSAGGSPKAPAGRCYLSLRAAALERQTAITSAPLLLVNALNMEQIRAIARRRLGADSPLYARFDDLIWRRLDIQKIAGTPLTAMLMVFFYEVYQDFARRYATYRLLVLFVLDRAWSRIKEGQFSGLNPFFREVLQEGFLEARPGLKQQYQGLTRVARLLLYHRRDRGNNESERAISRVELLELLTEWLEAQPKPLPDKADAKLWIEAWERENILLPSGPEQFVFLHSTVLEFLAAADLDSALAGGKPIPKEVNRVFGSRAFDQLETLPILCSASKELAWSVLKQLEPHAGGATAGQKNGIPPESTLPYRCLAEAEGAERKHLEQFQIERTYRRELQIIETPPEKDWAYRHIASWVRAADMPEEAARFAALEKRIAAVEELVPLCRPVLLEKYLADWSNDGSSIGRKQEELLRCLLEKELWESVDPSRNRAPSLPSSRLGSQAALRYFELLALVRGKDFARQVQTERERVIQLFPANADLVLALDLPGHAEDRNLAYYRAATTSALAAMFGSPNLKHRGAVAALAYSPDGRILAAGSADGLLILWDAESGRELRRLSGHRGEVNCCAFSLDGRQLASGSEDHTLMTKRSSCGRRPAGRNCAPSAAIQTGSGPAHSARTGGSWPARPMTKRSSCGRRPAGRNCAPSAAIKIMSGLARSARTGGNWPAGPLTKRSSCGRRPAGRNCAPSAAIKVWSFPARSA